MVDGVRVITDGMEETQGASAKPTFLTDGRNAKIIMRAIKADGYVTIANLCRKTRLSYSGVYKTIAALKAAFKIRRVGSPRNGHWEVIG